MSERIRPGEVYTTTETETKAEAETEKIKPNGVYTTKETKDFLRISESTIKRLLKKGIIQAAKIGNQYRILGKEILRLISPEAEKHGANLYQELKKKTKEIIKNW